MEHLDKVGLLLAYLKARIDSIEVAYSHYLTVRHITMSIESAESAIMTLTAGLEEASAQLDKIFGEVTALKASNPAVDTTALDAAVTNAQSVFAAMAAKIAQIDAINPDAAV
jgi:hypothetical protein